MRRGEAHRGIRVTSDLVPLFVVLSSVRTTGGYNVLIDADGTIIKRGRGFDLRMTLGELIPGESYAD